MNLADLQREAHAIACEKGWWDEPRSFGELIALVHSQLSEALEAYRTYQLENFCQFEAFPFHPVKIGGKPVGVASELADVVIRVADMAEWYEWDLRKSTATLPCLTAGDQAFGTQITALHFLVTRVWEARRESDHVKRRRLSHLLKGIGYVADWHGIDLDAAIEAKMEYNRGRSYRHGGKAL